MCRAAKSKPSGERDSVSPIDMKTSMRKIALPVLLLMVSSASIGFLLFGFHLIIGQTEQKGLADIRQILYELSILQETGPFPEGRLQELVVQQSCLIDARVIIIDMDSSLMADSRLGGQAVSGKYINAELSEAKISNFSSGYIRDNTQGVIQITIARTFVTEPPVTPTGKMVISVTYRQGEVHSFFLAFIALCGVFLVTGAGTVYLVFTRFSRQLNRPLTKLLPSDDSSAGGGLAKIRVDEGDEKLRELADLFNALADKYNLLIESDNRKYSRINTLLSHLKSGFLMTDREGRIIMVNPAAEEMLKLNKIGLFKIRNIQDCQSEVLGKISEAISDVNSRLETVEFSRKTDDGSILEISVEAVYNKYRPHEHSGALVILRDVTESCHLEQLKDDFIANVSHELRTPLTLITGFVETLKSWELLSDEDRNTSLNIIEVETERLKKLINELLLLSKIEGDISRTVEESPVRIKEVLENVVTLFESIEGRKNH